AVQLDLGAGPLAEQHPVAGLHVERVDDAVLRAGARTDRDHLALHGLLLGGVRDDDPAGRLLVGFDATHDHPVVQGSELHANLLAKTRNKIAKAGWLLALPPRECQTSRRIRSALQEAWQHSATDAANALDS